MQARTIAAEQDREPANSDLDHLVGYNLKRVYMIFVEQFRRARAEGNLSARYYSVLSLIVGEPGITQSDIARRLGIERSGLVAIIDGLQERGYAERMAVEGDRRVQALSPTDAGRKACEAATAAQRAYEQDLLSVLSDTEQAQFRSILSKIRNAHEGDPE